MLFLIWELTEEHPVVDLTLFKRRNFTVSTVAMLLAYGLFFGNVVLLPLWLQQYMGYTATLAGLVLAPVGLLAIFCTPVVGRLSDKVDPTLDPVTFRSPCSRWCCSCARTSIPTPLSACCCADLHSGRRAWRRSSSR